MLKYHNFDNPKEKLELLYNGKEIKSLTEEEGRDYIEKMRSVYFSSFDIVSITDFDDVKKRLMKNKIKVIVIDIFGKLLNEYDRNKDPKVFIDALSINGLILNEITKYVDFIFGDNNKNKEYYLREQIRIFSDNIMLLKVLTNKKESE